MTVEKQTKLPEGDIIDGVVHPIGSGGVMTTGQLWSLVFSFYAWRGSDGIIHKTKLRVEKTVTHEQLRGLMDQIKALSVIRARIILSDNAHATLVELLDESIEDDDPLNQIVSELTTPLTHDHPRFGTFEFDRRLEIWEANVTWDSKGIQLRIPGTEISGPDQNLLQTAIALWDDQIIWSQRISNYAVSELLSLKNDLWLEDNEVEVSADQFKSRMSLESITIYDEGGFDFFHEDGDLFFGHWIEITGDLKNGPIRADIPG